MNEKRRKAAIDQRDAVVEEMTAGQIAEAQQLVAVVSCFETVFWRCVGALLAVENIRRAAEIAADHGVRLGIEPLNRFETDLVNTLDQGLRMNTDVDRPNVGLLLDTLHMNIEEKDIPASLRRAAGHIIELHACSSDRGTTGEDRLPWPAIVAALRDAVFRGPVVSKAFTPAIKEIARAVSIWRLLAESEAALAANDLRSLRAIFAATGM